MVSDDVKYVPGPRHGMQKTTNSSLLYCSLAADPPSPDDVCERRCADGEEREGQLLD